MTSGRNHHWTSGNAQPWILGVTLGLILGLILLIVIPRTIGGHAAAAAPAAEGAAASGTAAGSTSAGGTAAGSTEAATTTPAASGDGAATAAGAEAGNAENGKTFFAGTCAGCHGANAEGGVGPKLDEAAAWTLAQFGAAVHEGKAPDKTLAAMMPHFSKDQVSDQQLADTHAFLQQTFGIKAEAAPAAAAAANDTAATDTAGAGDAAAGKEKFAGTCAGCHGANGEGGVGPALKVAGDWTPEQFAAAVREGKAPDKTLGAMMPHFTPDQVSDTELANIHAFVKTLN